jgi:hypothetical protein
MKRSSGFLGVAALLGIGLCGIVYRSAHTAAEPHPTSDLSVAKRSTDAAVAVQLAEMRRKLAELEHQVLVQGQRPTPAGSTKAEELDPSTAADVRTDAEARVEHDRKRKEYMAGVAAAFRTEPMDPRWSSVTSFAIQTALAVTDHDLQTLARAVECRSRTCRVEMADDPSGKLAKLLPVFVQHVGQELLSSVVERIEDARGATMVIYLSRRDDTRAPAS